MKTVTLRLLEKGGNFVGLFTPTGHTAYATMHKDEITDLFCKPGSPEAVALSDGEEIEIDVTARIK